VAASDHLNLVQHKRYTRPGYALNAAARKLAPQGTAEQLWEMADYHALKGNRNDEEEYRRAARLREGQ
jgi:hypothetical protein